MLTSDYAAELQELILANKAGWLPGTTLGSGFEVIDGQGGIIVVRGPFGSLWGFDWWDLVEPSAIPEVFQMKVVPHFKYERQES